MAITFDAANIFRRLPHRHPMVLLDRFEHLVEGQSGTGIKNITISDPVFQGHFPEHPVYPGIFMIEAAAQTCGLVRSGDVQEASRGYLASVRKFRFLLPVHPGDVLTIQARHTAAHAQLVEFQVDLSVRSRAVASGQLVLALLDHQEES